MPKRFLDLLLALFSLFVAIVPLSLIALCIKLTSRGPVLYRQQRVGRHAKLFPILKFRTMVQNADRLGPGVTSGDDPRVTRVGRFLRRSKLDELPQLLNVLRGEMSFVGPRPESPKYVAHYTEEQREVLRVRPGITGVTQLRWRNEEAMLQGVDDLETYYIEQVMPAKLASDLEYVRSEPGIRIYLKYLLQTVTIVLRPAR